MDSLNYNYYQGTNQLSNVRDAVPATNYPNDIDDEPSKYNYKYNAIGELAKDSAGGIDSIYWNVYGKVKKIVKTSTAYAGAEDSIVFAYDPLGNRLEKRGYLTHAKTCMICYPYVTSDTTLYQRDAQGNILAIYQRQNKQVLLNEWDLYGSKRIGTLDTNLLVYPVTAMVPPAPLDSITISYLEGQKRYELTNHLGNVLVTVSDRKWAIDTGVISNIADYYLPNIVNAQDYYPFGMPMPGRSYQILNDSSYHYGFNGKLIDNDIYGKANSYDYGMRMYDPRTGKFYSTDPLHKKYPSYSSYMYAGDKPIIAKDLDGEEEYVVIKAATSQNGRVRISVVYVPEAYRRADPHGGGAYNGIDYYIGNDKNVDNVNNRTMTPTFSSDVGFLNPQEAQKANEQTSYQTNTGRFSGTGSSLSSISTGGSHVGAKKSGDLKSSEGNYIYNTNHQVTNSYQTGAIGDVPVSNANFYFPTDISNNLAANTAPEAGLNVSAIVQNLISDPNANLNITGFASKSGNIDHNMELSKDRAKYVKQLVVNEAQRQGVTDINAFSRRITTNAVGSTTATGDQNADISTDRKVTATIQSGNQ